MGRTSYMQNECSPCDLKLILSKYSQHERSLLVSGEGGRDDDVVTRVQLKPAAHLPQVDVDARLASLVAVLELLSRQTLRAGVRLR